MLDLRNMEEDIKKILEYGVMAPSGDNSQPWRFSVKDNKLFVYNLPEKDNPYLNFKQSGSLIAHGALLFNIKITSQEFGYEITEDLFPGEKDLVAILTFKKSAKKKHPLFDFIKKRHTNRKPYENKALDKETLDILTNQISQDIKTVFITDPQKKIEAANGGANAEIVILENKTLHDHLFKDVVWTESQNKKKKSGLFIKTMEFNPIQKLLFYLAQYWTIMRIAIKIGFPKFIAKEDTELYATGGALGIISTKDPSPENFILIGKEMQRIWLESTRLNIAFQPVSGTLYFNFRAKHNRDDIISDTHKKLLKKSFEKIAQSFSLGQDDTPLMMFRLGYANNASARSPRKNPFIN